MLWARKLSSLLLISVATALLFLPFPDRLAGERVEEIVQLEIRAAPLTESAAKIRFGTAFVQFDYDGLGRYPQVREAVVGLAGVSGSRCVHQNDWRSLLDEFSIAAAPGTVYAFRDGIYRISEVWEEVDPADRGRLVCADVDYLGAYDNPGGQSFRRLTAGDLASFPTVNSELQRLAAGPGPAIAVVDVPPRQWRRFSRQVLGENDYRPSFVVYDRLFAGGVQERLGAWSLKLPWLRTAGRVMGAVALVFGIWIAIGAYRLAASRAGIPVSPGWLAVFCDFILLAWGIIFVALAMDTLWVGPLGQPSLLGLEPQWPSQQKITGLHFVSLPAVFIALPLMSLWFTSLSSQRIRIDDKGVTSFGALGSVSIFWGDLQDVRLRDQRNPFSFAVLDFRSLQRVVDLEAGNRSITVNEPASRRNKQALLQALERHIPEGKRELISTLQKW